LYVLTGDESFALWSLVVLLHVTVINGHSFIHSF